MKQIETGAPYASRPVTHPVTPRRTGFGAGCQVHMGGARSQQPLGGRGNPREGAPARGPRQGTELGLWSEFPRELTEPRARSLVKADPQRRPRTGARLPLGLQRALRKSSTVTHLRPTCQLVFNLRVTTCQYSCSKCLVTQGCLVSCPVALGQVLWGPLSPPISERTGHHLHT